MTIKALAAAFLVLLLAPAAMAAEDDIPDIAKIQKQADAGDADAQLKLGTAYREGDEGVDRDLNKAFKWTKMSAEQGNADAQFYLGFAYRSGDGVAKDDVKAYMWFDLSAKQGNERAIELRKNISETMTDDKIEEARDKSYHWKPGED